MSILTYPAIYTETEFNVLNALITEQKHKQSFNTLIANSLVQTYKLFNEHFCHCLLAKYGISEQTFDDILFDFYQKLGSMPLERKITNRYQLDVQLEILSTKHLFSFSEMLGALLDRQTESAVIQLQPIDIID